MPDEEDDEFDEENDGEEEFERPNEDHHHLDVVDEIAMLEEDDGRPKLKRG